MGIKLYIAAIFLGGLTSGAISCNTHTDGKSRVAEASQPSEKEIVVKFMAETTEAPNPDVGHIIIFKSGQTAFALGDFYQLLRTTNEGHTWQRLFLPPEAEKAFGGKFKDMVVSFYFIAPTRGWMSAERGTWQTEDGGNTWRLIFPYKWRFIDFVGEQQGVLSLYKDDGRYQTYVTQDDGESWKGCGVTSNSQTPDSTYFLTPRLGWGIIHDANGNGVNGIVRTADSGCSWRQVWVNNRNPGEQYNAIYFRNDREGWLAGDSNLYHTTNGGETWQEIWSLKENLQITDIYFSDLNNGWIIAATPSVENAGVFRTANGGKTWLKLNKEQILNELPTEWKAGELLQMLYTSRVHQ